MIWKYVSRMWYKVSLSSWVQLVWILVFFYIICCNKGCCLPYYFTHKWDRGRVKKWICVLPEGISSNWNANSFFQHWNLCCQVHFLCHIHLKVMPSIYFQSNQLVLKNTHCISVEEWDLPLLQCVSWIWHWTIWWWGSNSEALENLEYPFIAINTWSLSTC